HCCHGREPACGVPLRSSGDGPGGQGARATGARKWHPRYEPTSRIEIVPADGHHGCPTRSGQRTTTSTRSFSLRGATSSILEVSAIGRRTVHVSVNKALAVLKR